VAFIDALILAIANSNGFYTLEMGWCKLKTMTRRYLYDDIEADRDRQVGQICAITGVVFTVVVTLIVIFIAIYSKTTVYDIPIIASAIMIGIVMTVYGVVKYIRSGREIPLDSARYY
jgi:hypothetical protein